MNRALFATLFLLACNGDDAVVVTPKVDGGVTHDLSTTDAHVGDLSEDMLAPPDLSGDMSRPWIDVSVATAGSLWAVYSNGTGTVVAVGDNGAIYTSVSGGAFVADTSAKPSATPTLLSIGTIAPGPPSKPFYVAGQAGTVWSYSGNLAAATGTFTAEAVGTANSVNGIWVGPDGAAWGVGVGGAFKRTSGVWAALSGVEADSIAYNLWGTGNTGAYTLYAVGTQGPSASTIGKVWRSDGGNFIAQTSGTTSPLYGFFGAGASDLYAVGDDGVILHSIGNGAWTPQTSGVTSPIDGIGGVSADEIYAVGDSGVLLHKYEAASTTWVKETLPVAVGSRGIYGVFASTTEVYAVGAAGLILKR